MKKYSESQGETRLAVYTPDNKPQLEDYYLPEEQVQYTAHPIDALLSCESDPERHPIVILYENVPAGFFVLHGWGGAKDYVENRNALLLRAYSVNTSFQGRGIAQASLKLLPEFVRANFPGVDEVILTVNIANERAQHVYKKGGFIDKGIQAMGTKGLLLIYHMAI